MKINNLKGINAILKIGVYQTNSDSENKRVRLLNAFCFIWAVALCLFVFFDTWFARDFFLSFYIHLASVISIIITYALQYHKKYTIARVLFIISVITVTSLFANYIEETRLMENFYFAFPLVGLLFIDKKWINISVLILCFLLYYVPSAFLFTDRYPSEMLNPLLILVVFISNYVILNYSQILNKKNEKALSRSKQDLERAYVELEKRKQNELAFLQLKSLRSQMNPHFVFNSLNSIQDLVLQQDTESSYDYITLFAQLVRNTLNYSNKDFIPISEESSFLKVYLELEKLRFGDDFVFEIKHDNTDGLCVPSLIIQPFIENAMLHGLFHKSEGKKLVIAFAYTNELICTIVDNGIGRKKAKEIQERQGRTEHESFALKAIKERLDILKTQLNMEVGYTIMDLYDAQKQATGTKVEITMPYKKMY